MLDQTTGPGYASPEEAVKAPKEKIVYTVCIYAGTGIEKPDYLATIDADEDSPSYGQVIHRLPMPNIGDELHHSGWNACSSCHCDSSKERKYLILPGVRTSNFYIIDTKTDPKAPSLFKVVDGEEVKKKIQMSMLSSFIKADTEYIENKHFLKRFLYQPRLLKLLKLNKKETAEDACLPMGTYRHLRQNTT